MHESILFEIDAEIARLRASKELLLKTLGSEKRRPGRPAKNEKAVAKPVAAGKTRVMTAEGLERIRQAQFKRWAAVRKAKRAASRAAAAETKRPGKRA